jgi:hypothetical protein
MSGGEPVRLPRAGTPIQFPRGAVTRVPLVAVRNACGCAWAADGAWLSRCERASAADLVVVLAHHEETIVEIAKIIGAMRAGLVRQFAPLRGTQRVLGEGMSSKAARDAQERP